eukprot:6458628-Amphidinium_carterae.1
MSGDLTWLALTQSVYAGLQKPSHATQTQPQLLATRLMSGKCFEEPDRIAAVSYFQVALAADSSGSQLSSTFMVR